MTFDEAHLLRVAWKIKSKLEELRNLLRRAREEREREVELIRLRPNIYQHLQR
jgi:hypothetical protein